jgi:hypothetical protein
MYVCIYIYIYINIYMYVCILYVRLYLLLYLLITTAVSVERVARLSRTLRQPASALSKAVYIYIYTVRKAVLSRA